MHIDKQKIVTCYLLFLFQMIENKLFLFKKDKIFSSIHPNLSLLSG